MKKLLMIITAAAFAAGMASPAMAGDAEAGKALAKKCAACHGADGKGKKDNPAIAGMAEAAFIQDMQDFKSGKKDNKTMKRTASKLSDDDIANLAAYFASLK